ncbi:MAG: hypothetical protein HWN66_11830 [Candidatus Helarchaeota archaeon]|nr:hypothetical protein [Candidatus Helarchaeota archaeon]
MEFWETLGFGLTHIFSTCAFILFLVFLNKFIRIRKRSREHLPFLGLTIVFLCTSISYFIAVWADYYLWEYGTVRLGMYLLSFNAMYTSFAGLSFLFEYIFKKTKYLITIYLIICAILIVFLRDLETLNNLTLYTSAPMFLIIPLFMYYIFIKPTSGFLRQRISLSTLGIVMVGSGIFLRFSFLSESLGWHIYAIGTMIAIIGLCLFGYGFAAFSTFTDLNWKEKLREIFVVAPNGACVYAYSFDQNRSIKDSDLITGGFSGIQLLLSEMVQTSETLKLIDYQNVKIMLEKVLDYNFILIIKEESAFLRYKLEFFSQEFFEIFKDVIKNWFNNINFFKPTGTLIQRIFELS